MTSPQQPLRNVIHLMTGVAAGWVLFVPDPWSLLGLIMVFLVAASVDLMRLHAGFRHSLDLVLPAVYRADEVGRPSGATLLAAGYLLAVALLPAEAAAGGILALAVGDPAASVVGRWYGKRHGLGGQKTWVGSLGCFLATLPVIWLLPYFDLPAAAAAASMAALIERRAGSLDNLLIPIGVGLLLKLWVP